MNDTMSVRDLIKSKLNQLCYRTTSLNEQTLLDVLEHTVCYQTSSVKDDVPLRTLHQYVAESRNTSKKAIDSRLNRCKVDFILSLTTGDLWTLFGVDKYHDLKSITQYEFILAVSRYVANKL